MLIFANGCTSNFFENGYYYLYNYLTTQLIDDLTDLNIEKEEFYGFKSKDCLY